MLGALAPRKAPSIEQVDPGKGERDEARLSQQALMSEMGFVSGCWRGRSGLMEGRTQSIREDPAGTGQDEDVMESPLLSCVG